MMMDKARKNAATGGHHRLRRNPSENVGSWEEKFTEKSTSFPTRIWPDTGTVYALPLHTWLGVGRGSDFCLEGHATGLRGPVYGAG